MQVCIGRWAQTAARIGLDRRADLSVVLRWGCDVLIFRRGPLLPPERRALHLSTRGPSLLTWRAIRCLTTSCRATITSTVPLGTDVGLLVVLDAFAASL